MIELKNRLSSAFFALLCLLGVLNLTQCRGKTEPAVRADTPDAAKSMYSKRELAENVWRIDDNGEVNMYLVVGKAKALLIDTGMGREDLARFVRSITDKPVSVVDTHGHGDHAGGNKYFQTIFAHPADMPLLRSFKAGAADIEAVREGYVFDLGGRKLTVIETPGHTGGGICLLDADNRMLFTGDNNNTHIWLFLNESLPLETYMRSLERLIARSSEFAILYPGHGDALDPSFLMDIAECGRTILKGKAQGTPYRGYRNAVAVDYRGAKIVFDPKKIFEGN